MINERIYEGGIHEKNIGGAIAEFLRGGVSEYRILRPKSVDNKLADAVREFNFFFRAAAGYSLEVVYDESVDFDENSKFVGIGMGRVAAEAGIVLDRDVLGDSGYVIETRGKSVFLEGCTSEACSFAVYGFFAALFGYRFYSPDEWKIDSPKDLTLPEMHVRDVPDFPFREGGMFGDVARDGDVARRYRFNRTSELYLFGHNCHNSFLILPPELYFKDHPDWYVPNKFGEPAQLCFSNEEMTKEYIERLKPLVAAKPNSLLFLGIEDNHYWCKCPKCAALKEKYGTDAAVLIRFINRVAAEINEWAKESRVSDRDLRFLFFGYYATNDPPVKKLRNKYVPIDETVRLAPNVGVMYAPGGADFTKSFLDPRNDHYYEQLLRWSAVAERVHLWAYPLFAFNQLAFYPFAFAMKENYAIWRNHGVKCLLDQVQHEQGDYSVFARLEVFLQSELAWDIAGSDVGKLTDEFFAAYFREAAPAVRKYYDDVCAWYRKLQKTDPEYDGAWANEMMKESFMPKAKVDEWLGMFREALREAEKIPCAVERMKVIRRIKREELSPRYAELKIYASKMSEAELGEKRASFRRDFADSGVSRVNEIEKITSLWEEWGFQK